MTFEEQLEQLQKLFAASGCDIEILPPDEEKARKLRSRKRISPLWRRYSPEPAAFP